MALFFCSPDKDAYTNRAELILKGLWNRWLAGLWSPARCQSVLSNASEEFGATYFSRKPPETYRKGYMSDKSIMELKNMLAQATAVQSSKV